MCQTCFKCGRCSKYCSWCAPLADFTLCQTPENSEQAHRKFHRPEGRIICPCYTEEHKYFSSWCATNCWQNPLAISNTEKSQNQKIGERSRQKLGKSYFLSFFPVSCHFLLFAGFWDSFFCRRPSLLWTNCWFDGAPDETLLGGNLMVVVMFWLSLLWGATIRKSLPFTPKFLQINSPPGFFCIFFVIFTGIRCGMDIAQKPNKSGQILDQRWKIFCSFYEINSSQDFFLYCNIFGVDGISPTLAMKIELLVPPLCCRCTKPKNSHLNSGLNWNWGLRSKLSSGFVPKIGFRV